MKSLIVIPTYNEAENIALLIPAIFAQLPEENFDVLVVDDASPDGTAAKVRTLPQFGSRVFVLDHGPKAGLAAAYVDGFGYGLKRSYDAFLEMDADFSHRVEDLPAMFAAIRNADAVIGSRNVPGGGVENWPPLRRFISRCGSVYARSVLSCPVRDLTGGFNFWHRETLEKIDLQNIFSRGYSFQIEMKYRAFKAGCRIVEIPILFPDRMRGKSKMSKKIFIEAFFNVWKLRFGRCKS